MKYTEAEKQRFVALFVRLVNEGHSATVAAAKVCAAEGVSDAQLQRYRTAILGPSAYSRPSYSAETRAAATARWHELRNSGMKAGDVENVVLDEMGISAATLRRMVKGGAPSDRPKVVRGPDPKLSEAQVDELVAWVKAQPTATLYDLAQRTKREWQIELSPHTLSRALRARGYSKRTLSKEKRAPEPAPEDVPSRVGYTDQHRRTAPKHSHRKGYPSDLTNQEWARLGPLIRKYDPSLTRKHPLRDIVDAIRYQNRTGVQWRYLPHDFPPSKVVYHHLAKWARSGLFEQVNADLNREVRVRAGRDSEPTAAILDAQAVKTVGVVDDVGFDGNKKVKGRKRSLLTDVLGLVLAVGITAANVHDAVAAPQVVNAAFSEQFPAVERIFADKGYRGVFQRTTDADPNQRYTLEIVSPPNQVGDSWSSSDDTERSTELRVTRGFVVHRQRWKIERTNAWNSGLRRLRNDYDRRVIHSKARVFSAAVDRSLALLSNEP